MANWSSRKLFVVLVPFFGIVFFGIMFTQWGGDGSVAIGEAHRLFLGQKMYVDFRSIHMPLTSSLLALLFKLFGLKSWVVEALSSFIYVVIVLLSFWLARRLLQSVWLAVLSVLILFSVFSMPSVNHNWLALLFALIIVLLVSTAQHSIKQRQYLITAGFFLGLLAVTTLWQFSAVLLGVALYFIAYRRSIKQLVLVSLAASLIIALLLLRLVMLDTFSAFLDSAILFPLQGYQGANAQFPASVLFYSVGIFYAWYLFKIRENIRSLSKDEFLIAAVGLGYWLFAFLNPSQGHLALGFVFTAPLFIKFIVRWFPGKLSDVSFLSPTVLVSIVFIAGVLTSGVQTTKMICRPKGIIKTSSGNALVTTTETAEISLVKDNVDLLRGRKVLIVPWAPELAFFLNLYPAGRYVYMGPEHYSNKIQQEIVSEIKGNKDMRIIYVASLTPIFPYTPRSIEHFLDTHCEQLLAFWEQPYDLALRFDGVWGNCR